MHEIFLTILMLALIPLVALLPFEVRLLGRWSRWARRIACAADWHSPGRLWEVQAWGKARCPWCGFVGMVDSQGNLF